MLLLEKNGHGGSDDARKNGEVCVDMPTMGAKTSIRS